MGLRDLMIENHHRCKPRRRWEETLRTLAEVPLWRVSLHCCVWWSRSCTAWDPEREPGYSTFFSSLFLLVLQRNGNVPAIEVSFLSMVSCLQFVQQSFLATALSCFPIQQEHISNWGRCLPSIPRIHDPMSAVCTTLFFHHRSFLFFNKARAYQRSKDRRPESITNDTRCYFH